MPAILGAGGNLELGEDGSTWKMSDECIHSLQRIVVRILTANSLRSAITK
jgi:hypothetical protein